VDYSAKKVFDEGSFNDVKINEM